jgi:hypothetical protein
VIISLFIFLLGFLMADKTACLPPIQNEPVFIDLMLITTLI